MISLEKRVTVLRNTKTKDPNHFVPAPFSAVIRAIRTGKTKHNELRLLSATAQNLKGAAVAAEGTPAEKEKADEYRNWKANHLPAVIPCRNMG